MKHVEVPRTRALADNPHFDPDNPHSTTNPKMVEVEVPAYVLRHEKVKMKCRGKNCGEPFTATYDEIVREVVCPHCNRGTPTPEDTWGNP